MLIVEINIVGLQLGKRALEGLANIGRFGYCSSVDVLAPSVIGRTVEYRLLVGPCGVVSAEFGGQKDIFASFRGFEPPPESSLS